MLLDRGGIAHDHACTAHRKTGAAAAGAATLAPALTSPPQAAAPLGGQQAAGWYRHKVGDIEVTVATDGVNRFKFPDTFVLNQGRDQINAALVAGRSPPGRAAFSFYLPGAKI
jgi:hypothetical protein